MCTAAHNHLHLNRWVQNTYTIMGGKPLWIDPFDSTIQHIFIDDNIHQNDDDTIVHPKVSEKTLAIFSPVMQLKQLFVIHHAYVGISRS